MDNMEKVYEQLKSFVEKNGFPQTIQQISKSIDLSEHEVKKAMEKLQQSGRIKITNVPRETTIEFLD